MKWSFRLTLTAWYVGFLALVLIIFGWVLYENVAHTLFKKIDDLLVVQTDAFSESILAFWEAESLPREEAIEEAQRASRRKKKMPPSLTIQREVEAGRLPELVTSWARELSESESLQPLKILSREGKDIFASSSFQKAGLDFPRREQDTMTGHTVFETVEKDGERWRLITLPIIEGGKILYLVQSFASLNQADTSLDRLRLTLFILIPFSILFTSAGSWFLASLAIRPVSVMIRQAGNISADRLHERLAVPRTGDELQILPESFNRLLERLEKSFRRLRQFSTAASHELRTPLTVMKGELELALRRPRDIAEYQRVLKTQQDAVDDMIAVVEQLLMIGRSETGKDQIDWSPVHLKTIAADLVSDFEPIAEKKDVGLVFEGSDEVSVRGEGRLLKRLVSNLIDNALRHTPEGGRIEVIVSTNGQMAIIEVRDTGKGISPEDMPRLFDQFFHRSGQDQGHSTGLGLGLCRWIAEAHHGYIQVESSQAKVDSSKGQRGTVFSVHLPLMR